MTDILLSPPDEPVAGMGAGRLLVLLLAGFLACFAATLALPDARYLRFQQLGGTAMHSAIWIYERTTFDRTPIDIAIIGASRTEIGISAPRLQAGLSARLGRPIHVANLSMPQDGRDLHYEITKRLLATHPEVKLILYSVIEHPSRMSHPVFRNIADVADVVHEPTLLNPSWLENIAYLPYRQLSLFPQSLRPDWFGVHSEFRPQSYWGADHDTTVSYRAANGRWMDRDSIHPAARLAKEADHQVAVRTQVFLPRAERDYEYAIERHYTRAIADMARRHGVQIGFVYLPIYNHVLPIDDIGFYRARGFVLNGGFVGADHRNYSDYAHLNRIGTAKVTAALTTRLVAMEQAGAVSLVRRPPGG